MREIFQANSYPGPNFQYSHRCQGEESFILHLKIPTLRHNYTSTVAISLAKAAGPWTLCLHKISVDAVGAQRNALLAIGRTGTGVDRINAS